MRHTEFKNSALAKPITFCNQLPLIIGSLIMLISVVFAFARAIDLS